MVNKKRNVKLTCFVTKENREWLNSHEGFTATDVIDYLLTYCRTNNVKVNIQIEKGNPNGKKKK